MDLRQIRYFLAVAAEGSFSRAANTLHMTQPPLSLAIGQLEKELGVRLLDRHPHGVSCTEAGAFLVTQGTQLLKRTRRIEDQLRDMGNGTAGQLQLAAVPSFSWSYLTPLLNRFSLEAPGSVVELSDPTPQEALNQLAAGTIDIAIVATGNAKALQGAYENELSVTPLQEMPLVAALPPSFRDAPDPIDMSSLMGETWLLPQLYPRFPGLPELVNEAWTKLGRHPSRIRTVSTLQTAIPLIAAGMGIGVMPDSVSQMAGSHLVVRRFVQPITPLQGCLVSSLRHARSPAVQKFIDMALGGARP
ncbi:LysR substrate-binding domain-containing protein [Paeniglutamicibacter psychrophenolicus]|nr:LysR family transcriptional regulator [Paeniglutamicibacter psychrophenolicus]